jgi:hypothetical protein
MCISWSKRAFVKVSHLKTSHVSKTPTTHCTVLRFDADPDPDPTFQCYANPGPDSVPDWHQHNADPQSGSYPLFYTYWKIGQNFLTFVHSNASLQCFSVLISGKRVMIFSILDSILNFSLKNKKYKCLDWCLIGSGSCKMMRIRPDPAHNSESLSIGIF